MKTTAMNMKHQNPAFTPSIHAPDWIVSMWHQQTTKTLHDQQWFFTNINKCFSHQAISD